jgi:lysophospholipase L1-like esterase
MSAARGNTAELLAADVSAAAARRTTRILRAGVALVFGLWTCVGIAVLMLIAIEALAGVWLRTRRPADAGEDARVRADGYVDADWVRPYFDEFAAANHVTWRSYVYWRRQPFHGRYVNIDERGLRDTWNSPNPAGQQRPRIFLFGGSTMWGTGARDEHTIASALSRQLAERGIAGDVTNFGEGGYSSRQELIALETELQDGNVPELVVFLDGVNDVFAAFQNGAAGIPQNEGNRVREFNIDLRIYREALQNWVRNSAVYALLVPPPVPQQPADPDSLAADVIAHYAAVATMVGRLGQSYGFRSLFFWQPVIFTKPQRTSYEQAQFDEQAFLAPFYSNVYGRMRADAAASPAIHYLGDLFASDRQPYYIDFCHLTETGNDRIAAAMAGDVAAALEHRN